MQEVEGRGKLKDDMNFLSLSTSLHTFLWPSFWSFLWSLTRLFPLELLLYLPQLLAASSRNTTLNLKNKKALHSLRYKAAGNTWTNGTGSLFFCPLSLSLSLSWSCWTAGGHFLLTGVLVCWWARRLQGPSRTIQLALGAGPFCSLGLGCFPRDCLSPEVPLVHVGREPQSHELQ